MAAGEQLKAAVAGRERDSTAWERGAREVNNKLQNLEVRMDNMRQQLSPVLQPAGPVEGSDQKNPPPPTRSDLEAFLDHCDDRITLMIHVVDDIQSRCCL